METKARTSGKLKHQVMILSEVTIIRNYVSREETGGQFKKMKGERSQPMLAVFKRC